MEDKPFYKSKKLWGYIIATGVLIVASLIGLDKGLEEIKQLAMVYLGSQGAVDVTKSFMAGKSEPFDEGSR